MLRQCFLRQQGPIISPLIILNYFLLCFSISLVIFLKRSARNNLLCLSHTSSFQLLMCFCLIRFLTLSLEWNQCWLQSNAKLIFPSLAGELVLSLCLGVHKSVTFLCVASFINFYRHPCVSLELIM